MPIITDLTLNRDFKIKNFEEDKIATLNAHTGLFYWGKIRKKTYKFSGNFYLTNSQGSLIESFEIVILIDKAYPNTFPIVILLDDKIEKSEDYHMNNQGIICLEHTYIANAIASKGIRLFDFLSYYLPKYFSWALVKKYGNEKHLQEWGHGNIGIKQFYKELIGSNEKSIIHQFLINYCEASKIERNVKCYCGSGKKLKDCHYEEVLFLKRTSKKEIIRNIALFE